MGSDSFVTLPTTYRILTLRARHSPPFSDFQFGLLRTSPPEAVLGEALIYAGGRAPSR